MPTPSSLAIFSVSLPLGEYGWLYYAISASIFLLVGIVCGYFIWRKGHMQTLDAEMEIQLNESELKSHTQDFEKEVENLDVTEPGDPVAQLLSNFGSGSIPAESQQG